MIEKFDIFKDNENNCFQLRTKTNSYALEFDDKEKENIFLKIVSSIQKKSDQSLKQLKSKFGKNSNSSKVMDVFHTLNEYGLLPIGISVEINEKGVASVKSSYTSDNKNLDQVILAVVGDSDLSKNILESASILSLNKIVRKNYHELNDSESCEQLINESDFLIVDGNNWSPYHLELINELCLKNNKPWLYVGGLEEILIKIGPLFYGKETGCYNCLISRIKSNHGHPTFLNSYEIYLKNNKIASKSDELPHSELFHGIVANIVLTEVVKFFEEWSLPVTWRTYISFNVINYEITRHALLKKPFCEICKPNLEYNPAPWLEAITLK
ncbi:MAG: TOMM precursor leader peptide-binding protein [Cytophagales bacterium]|nr:TOMM precursor leader peptide-binding protein [Cytophagales bacterium]